MSDKADWLAGLKVGDPVIVKYSPGKAGYSRKITQIGADLIIVDSGARFNRSGRQGHHGLWLVMPTAAQAREAER